MQEGKCEVKESTGVQDHQGKGCVKKDMAKKGGNSEMMDDRVEMKDKTHCADSKYSWDQGWEMLVLFKRL